VFYIVLASGFDSGYRFEITVFPGGGGTPPSYVCVAIPIAPGKSGYKMYYVDATNIIRVTNDGTLPGPTSPDLE